MTAAIDTRRLGCAEVMETALLTEAAGAYLDVGLRRAAARVHGVRALTPRGGPPPYELAGYELHDYLHQHGSVRRFFTPVPAATWDAIARNVSDPEQLTAVGNAAHDRGDLRRLWREAGWDPSRERRLLAELPGVSDRVVDLFVREVPVLCRT